ncbi:hypothetical protein ACSNOD_19800, partial [Streptomyces sp. URMC 123]
VRSGGTGDAAAAGLTAGSFAAAGAALARLSRNAERQRTAATPTGPESRAAEGAPTTAVAPYGTAAPVAPAAVPASRAEGGFDFFGTQSGAAKAAAVKAGPAKAGAGTDATVKAAPAKAAPARDASAKAGAAEDDLADVVGAEAYAEHEEARGAADEKGGEVIDLTEHDETEQLDVSELRARTS